MNRRDFLKTSATATVAAQVTTAQPSARPAGAKRLGLTDATYHLRLRAEAASGPHQPFENALDMLRHAALLGAGCVQTSVRGWDQAFAGEVRTLRESLGIALEGQIRLPDTAAEVPAFEAAARAAQDAGAHILRTVCLGGRRYETFKAAADWKAFKAQSWTSLRLAEPVVRKLGLVLAVENHKDWRIAEILDLIKRLDSEAVGICLDTGNNVSLLEDPMAVVEALAPWARTIHFKDMGVGEYEDGFLLAEVPLGTGYLDLARIVEICNAANPDVQFNLEMITRDPLKVPVLTDAYWVTFDHLPAQELAQTLAQARHHAPEAALPHIAGLTREEQLALEEQHNRASFAYAREHLGL